MQRRRLGTIINALKKFIKERTFHWLNGEGQTRTGKKRNRRADFDSLAAVLGPIRRIFFETFFVSCKKFLAFLRDTKLLVEGVNLALLSQPIVDRKLSAPVVAFSTISRAITVGGFGKLQTNELFLHSLPPPPERERDPKIVTFEEFKTISPPPRRRRCCLALKIYDKLQKVERSRFSSFYSLTTFARNLSRRIYKISNVSSSAASAAASWKNYQQCGRSRGELCCCTANIAFNACLN